MARRKKINEIMPRIYLPFKTIEKGVVGEFESNTDNKKEMIIEGCAGTEHLDIDNQRLSPRGFILEYFLKSGFINWNHQMGISPDSIIGEPIHASIDNNNQFNMKGRLYPWSPLARNVYETASNLESDPDSDRTLGYSVEGVALEEHGEWVDQILITSCAVAPVPKNNKTYLQICKGITVDEIRDIRKQVILEPVYSEIEKGVTKDYILDIEVGGRRVLVDTDFNFKVRESEIETPSLQEIQKAIINLAKAKEEGLIKHSKVNELKQILKEKRLLIN